MKPAVGLAFGDRYELRHRIAVGGMGEVWSAHDRSLARDVAIKVLKEEFAGDPGFLARFRTEARNAASLSHPNIAQPYDYGEQNGSAYIVMELVLGEPMSDLLAREPVLPLDRLLPILAQTARALHAAHVAGVVHRDVKPGNILLGRGGRVKITDFGVSLATNQISLTATGMVMGTAQYLSPEQALGKPATPSSDIYSLGVVAYEAVVGHRPFTGESAVDIAVAHVNRPVPPLPHSVDRAMAGLVMRMLSKDPIDRPRSAASLARTLDAMLPATPPGGVGTLGRPGGSSPVSAASARDAGTPASAARSALTGASGLSAQSVPSSRSAASSSSATSTPSAASTTSAFSAASAAGVPSGTSTPSAASAAEAAFASAPTQIPPSYPPRRLLRDPLVTEDTPIGDEIAAHLAAAREAGMPPSAGPILGASANRGPSAGVGVGASAPVPPPPVGAGTGARPGSDRIGLRRPRRTSTTTGQRLGSLSWPLVALMLLLLAVFGATLATRLLGAGTAELADPRVTIASPTVNLAPQEAPWMR